MIFVVMGKLCDHCLLFLSLYHRVLPTVELISLPPRTCSNECRLEVTARLATAAPATAAIVLDGWHVPQDWSLLR